MRLIVGSANLTRQGFRHNYECVASVDYAGKNATPRSLLATAIGLIREIGAGSQIPQLSRQLAAFAAPAAAVAAIRAAWAFISNKAPDTVTIVSPFWTEGSSAPEALFNLSRQLGSPASLEMICCGERSADGKTWLPMFDSSL